MATEEWPPKSNKSPEMQGLVSGVSGHHQNIYMKADCATCDKIDLKPSDFKNELSKKEFGISRLCQECQDKVFGNDEVFGK
ncbi:hypothetical protein LCGC14_1306020 [marine sediment metagenome]|uniref:Uncharacterized protein n=1 Tax=marine sediment metagenome TaxID=412755 RepID=A0A0F9NR67_9ZZZZ